MGERTNESGIGASRRDKRRNSLIQKQAYNELAEPSGRNRSFALVVACAALLGAYAPAAAQSGAPNDSVGQDAVDAATQPLSDFNLRSRDIPDVLLLAQEAPYSLSGIDNCETLGRQIALLETTLGPDADVEDPDGPGLLNQGLKLGGDVLSGFIPFRGIIRRVSGARAEEKRWEAAIYAGVARRSFLKGYATGLECPTQEPDPVESARDLLGMGPKRNLDPEVEVIPQEDFDAVRYDPRAPMTAESATEGSASEESESASPESAN